MVDRYSDLTKDIFLVEFGAIPAFTSKVALYRASQLSYVFCLCYDLEHWYSCLVTNNGSNCDRYPAVMRSSP